MKFEFATATRIIFGAGVFRETVALAAECGKRALVVTGKNVSRADNLLASLRGAGIDAAPFSVAGEPDIAIVEDGVTLGKKERCDFVIGFGGGSSLDVAKAIAAMLTNGGDLLDYLEVIGRGKPLTRPSAPFLAIPTTAGTGSEVTRNAVLASPEHGLKVSLRSPHMLAKIALVDPDLTCNLPPAITARTGMDALTQVLEPFVCLRANPMTDGLCEEGLRRAARSLRVAFHDGQNKSAREDMALTSLFGGLALANAGLGAVHGFAGAIGGQFPTAPHGAICAALLPHIMSANIRALRQRDGQGRALKRYEHIARICTADAPATADAGVDWVRQLIHELQIPGLGTYGVKSEHIENLVRKSIQASSMKANPIALTPDELAEALGHAL
ncbi:MAG TPA: iron-containing alcohol dehydrogenase [Verrucomicrobiae bacterium]|nr:iron-containing alcohol dehydrogenase [Verrucomicrobiae bacterium]